MTNRDHDYTGCQQCDGDGRIWNNADPTSGQWVDCECALAAGAQSAETNEDLAQSEGRQSGPNGSEGNAR